MQSRPHAHSSWYLAKLDLQRQEYQSAYDRLIESFQINLRLQRVDGIATVGLDLAQLLIAVRQFDAVRQILTTSLAAATKLGNTALLEQINTLLAQVPDDESETT